jgi:MFS transporter, DHA2 family, methylenomycin A resistance protein
MLPMSLFSDPAFTIPNVASFVLGFGTSAVFFLLSLYLQNVQDHSPMAAGLRYLPLTLAICLTAPLVGRLSGRLGPYPVMVGGYVLSGAGLAGLALLGVDASTAAFSVAGLVLGVGMGASIAPTQAAAVLAVPRERSGLASACVSTSRQSGTTMGVAVLGVIIASFTDDALPGTDAYRESFVDGLHIAGLASGAATIAAGLLVLVLLRRGPAPAPPGGTSAAAGRRRAA